jgi:hypothetical protein
MADREDSDLVSIVLIQRNIRGLAELYDQFPSACVRLIDRFIDGAA